MPYWRLFYHFVWGTKGGEPLIEMEWEIPLHNVIAAKAAQLEAMVYAVGGTDNHIHLVASVPPKVALSMFVGQVKGSSSHWINHDLKPAYQFAWQSEFGVVSFGGKQLDAVVRYAKNQRQHHGSGTMISGLERVAPSDVGGAELQS
jgi:REP element-mobilizing transposase RayT